MKYIKLFESFVNEELTQGTKLSQALILHLGKEPKEKGPEMDKWKEDRKVYEEALKDYLKEYDIDVRFFASQYDKSMNLIMYFPESFMSKVKNFFGFGKSKIYLTYCVKDLTNLTDDFDEVYSFDDELKRVLHQTLEEDVKMSIGVDRSNRPSGTDISKVDTNRSNSDIIELDRKDARTMCKLLQDINPNTKLYTPNDLVEALNKKLEGSFKSDVERSQTDAGYKFVVLNQITLV